MLGGANAWLCVEAVQRSKQVSLWEWQRDDNNDDDDDDKMVSRTSFCIFTVLDASACKVKLWHALTILYNDVGECIFKIIS